MCMTVDGYHTTRTSGRWDRYRNWNCAMLTKTCLESIWERVVEMRWTWHRIALHSLASLHGELLVDELWPFVHWYVLATRLVVELVYRHVGDGKVSTAQKDLDE